MKTKCARIHEFGKPLKIENIDTEALHTESVMIKVNFSGINFYEKLLVEGKYPTSANLPLTIGGEFSGEVLQIGENVKDFKVGDRVFSLALSGKGTSGGFANIAVIEEKYLYHLPDEITFEQGAAIPMIFFTAYSMLSEKVNMKDGQTVLIHSVAGGVGSTLAKLIKAMYPNSIVIGTYSSIEKEKIIKDLKIDVPICSENVDLITKINNKFPQGIDVIFDPVGQNMVSEHLSFIKPLSGIWCTYGAYSGPIIEENLVGKLRSKNATLAGFLMWPLIENKKWCENKFKEIFKLMKQNRIEAQIDKIFPLEEINQAFNRMSDRKNLGKILIKCNE